MEPPQDARINGDLAVDAADLRQNRYENDTFLLQASGEAPEQLMWSRLEQKSCVINQEIQETSETDMEELKRKIVAKQQLLELLKHDNRRIKESLFDVIERRRILAESQGRVLLARRRIELVKQAYENNKSILQEECEQLKTLERSNLQREQRIRRVRQKNFRKKEAELSEELSKLNSEGLRKMTELVAARRQFVNDISRQVFPIEVESLSERDDGEEFEAAGEIDCDASLDVDGGWVLSGIHRHSYPSMRIVTASLPSNGDHSNYTKSAAERRRAYSQQGTGAPSLGDVPPIEDPFFSTPAALLYTAQLVELIADVLDQPLPYPVSRRDAIGTYGKPGHRRRVFLDSVAKLDDNILYLCFSQNVPLSALTPGHTLQNLLGLVTHTLLGRSGAFECHPELTRYRSKGGASSALQQSHDWDDNEPPNISYTADQLILSDREDYDDIMESMDDESDSDDSNEWGDPVNYVSSGGSCKEDSSEMDSLVKIEKFETEWEHLEPSEQETKLFEEEQMKRQLLLGSSHSHTHQLPSPSAPSSKQAMTEREIRRDRLRRLDYESTYMEFAANVASSGTSQELTVQLNATDSVRLFGSIDETSGRGGASPTGGGVASTPGTGTGTGTGTETETEIMKSKEAPPTEENQGFFGTLSSLWASTFGGRAS